MLMKLRAGNRMRTNESHMEFVLIRREPRQVKEVSIDGWLIESVPLGGIDWISDWQLSHCTLVVDHPSPEGSEG